MQQDGDDADDEYDDDALYDDFEITPEILRDLDKVEHDELAACKLMSSDTLRLVMIQCFFLLGTRCMQAESRARKCRLQALHKAAECPKNCE